jgi:hypothetical protein
MILDGHVFDISGEVFEIRARGDIKSALEGFQGFMFECEAVSETAKGEPLSIFVKAIGPGEEVTGSKGPSVLVVASFQESFF